jgi:NAD(P)-dependent dehydrogenase (short-subunit alcohol dehydrogenase family)
MKILVTGGTGFTGKALVKRLVGQGDAVISLDYQEGVKTDEIRSWGQRSSSEQSRIKPWLISAWKGLILFSISLPHSKNWMCPEQLL